MPIDEKQITNKQHAVPQNIMDVDFKIIGDLTLREFIYLLVFFGLAYWAFMTINFVVKWPVILFFVLTGIIFARGRFGERGVDEWVVNFFRAIYNPTQKVWRKSPIIPTAFSYQNLDFVKNELITLAPTATRRKLENYLENYNTAAVAKESYEQKEEDYIRKVNEYNYNAATPVVDNGKVPATGNIAVAVADDMQATPVPIPQDAPIPQQVEPTEEKKPEEAKEKDTVQEKPTLAFDIKSMYHKIKPATNQASAAPMTPPQTVTAQTSPANNQPVTQSPAPAPAPAPAPIQATAVPSTTPAPTPTAQPVKPTEPEEKLPELSQFKEVNKTTGMNKILLQMKQTQLTYKDTPTPVPTTTTPVIPVPAPTTTQEPEPKPIPVVEHTEVATPTPNQEQPKIYQEPPTPFMPKQTPYIEPTQAAQEILSPFQMPYPASNEQKPIQADIEPYKPKNEPIMPSVTPDRVAGRRFTQLAMDQQGTIILPIRGEKVLRTDPADEPAAQRQLEEKTQQLQVLLEQIRRESGIASATINAPKQPQQQQQTPQYKPAPQQAQIPQTQMQTQNEEEVLRKLQSENQRLIDEIGHLKVEMAKTQAMGNLQQQEQVLQSASLEQEVLKKQIEELRTKITQKEVETEALRKREQQRIEDERKQAETLRLMMQMQSEKDRKEHDKKEKEALARYEEERKKLEEKQKEETTKVQEEARLKEEKALKESRAQEQENKRLQQIEAQKFAEEEKRRIEQEQQKTNEQRRKEEELQKNKELQLAKEQELQKKKQAEELQKSQKEREEKMQAEAKAAQEKALKDQKEQAERALKEAEARAYEEQKRIEAAKQRAEEERKRQEEAFKTSKNATVPAFAKMQPITTMPNAVSGVVKNKEGKTLEGILVIIKRENGEPVRALKTNILGQFAITTPLSNGVYIIEIDKSGSTNEKFDIIRVTADGKPIPPLDFTGH